MNFKENVNIQLRIGNTEKRLFNVAFKKVCLYRKKVSEGETSLYIFLLIHYTTYRYFYTDYIDLYDYI